MYVQADLRLCWSRIPHCWKSHVAAQLCPKLCTLYKGSAEAQYYRITRVTVLCPWVRHYPLLSTCSAQEDRRLFPPWLKNCWLGCKTSTHTIKTNNVYSNDWCFWGLCLRSYVTLCLGWTRDSFINLLVWYLPFNAFLASGDFCCLLITYANSLNPDLAPRL